MSELILISRITKVKNIRKEYGDIPGLAENIYNVGLINPLIVTKNKPQPGTPAMPDTYTLHAGDRRFKAMQHICKKYGLNQMEYLARAEIMELDEQLAELIQLSENIERKDLTPFEEIKKRITTIMNEGNCRYRARQNRKDGTLLHVEVSSTIDHPPLSITFLETK